MAVRNRNNRLRDQFADRRRRFADLEEPKSRSADVEEEIMKYVNLAALAAMTLLAGCATFQSKPVISQADAGGVTYRIKGNQLEDTVALAQAHCATFGRTAFQESVSRGSGDSRIVRYLCN
jgi:hypothetical protein